MDKLYEIRKMISEVTGVPPDDFGNRSRLSEYIMSRQLYTSVLRDIKNMSVRNIGNMLSRNHATIIHTLNEVGDLCVTNKKYNQIHSLVIDKANRIINGEKIVPEDSIEIKDLKRQIIALNIQIDNLKGEVTAWMNECNMLKRKIAYSKLADSFSG